MTTIYLYGLDSVHDENMNALAARYGYEVVRWDEKDLGHVVGHLTGRADYPADTVPVAHIPKTTFLLFDELPRETLGDFIADLREEVGYFPHKASTTKNNLTWRLVDLISHNVEEHAVMEKLTRVMRLLPLAESVRERFPDDAKLAQAIDAAKPYTKPREVELEEITACYENLLAALAPYEKLFQKS